MPHSLHARTRAPTPTNGARYNCRVGERRVLVVGAPNDRFGELDFVSRVTVDLHRVLLDPDLGACRPALPDGRELLVGEAATRSMIVTRLEDAFRSAAEDLATLFVYFIGHGVRADDDFYLIAADTPGPNSLTSHNAVLLVRRSRNGCG